MKLRRLAAALLLATTLAGQPAEAEAAPIIGAVAALAATPLGATVLEIGLGFVASGIESLIQGFTNKPATTSTTQGVDLQLGQSGIDPQAFVVGYHPTAGSLNYHGSWGSAGGTPNAYYVQEIIIADLPMRELAGAWAGDQCITIPDMSGARPTVQGWPVPEYRSGGVDYMWLDYRSGAQTAASAYLTGKFGDDADRPYSADMVGRGRSIVTVTMRVNDTLYSGGVPKFIWETTGIDLYDLSKDSTAGGSGSQRAGDSSTWAPSNNLIVQIYNVLKGIFWGDEWVFGLQDSTLYQLPASAWIAAINECNLAIALEAGGTEPQFAGGLEIRVSSQAADVIATLLKACAGRLAEIGGIYKPLVGLPVAPVYSFTDANVVITQARGIDPFPAADDTYNAAQGSYPERSQAWASKDAPAYIDAELAAQDGGQRMAPDLQFDAAFSGTHVQRLLKGSVVNGRDFRRPSLVLPPEASELEPLDMVSWTSTSEGYNDKDFLILQVDDQPTYLTPVQLLETNPASFDWNPGTDEQPSSLGFLTSKPVPSQIVEAPAILGVSINDNAGTARRFGAQFVWDGTVDDVRAVGMQIRDDAGNTIVSTSTDNVSDGTAIVSSAVMIPDQHYQGREIYYPASNRPSDWCDWLDFRTPKVLLTGSDIAAATIAASNFVQDIQNRIGPLLDDIQGKLDEHDALFGDISELVAGSIATRQSAVRGIAVQSAAQQAAIVETMDVSIENQKSVATLETNVVAKIGPIGAGIDWKAVTSADVGSGIATLSFAVVATDGTLSPSAAFELMTSVAGGVATSQINLMANNINFVDAGGAQVAVPFFTAVDVSGISYAGIQNLRVNKITDLAGTAFTLDGTSNNALGKPYLQFG